MIRPVPILIFLVLALCVLIQHSNACGGGGGSSGGGGNSGGGGSSNGGSSNRRPGYPFRSSQTNKDIADKNYPNSPVQKYVATALGDELPKMRDDLINRKNKGEGVISRHIKAWTNKKNWQRDPDNNRKEIKDPAKGKR